jgi:CheY-like chemotaxis protein
MPLISRTVRLAVVDSTPADYAGLLAATGTVGVSLHFLFSGYDALNFARRWQMSLWIVNSRLCDMSGFELSQKLRSQRPNASIFIIGDEYQMADELQTMTQGLTKYLCKPLEPSWVLPPEDESCIPLSASRDPISTRCSESVAGQPTCETFAKSTVAIRAGSYPHDRDILPFENSSTRRPAA